ncbi:MAG: NUDIX hydrolase [Deltaproteobacteria bacterium]
MPPKKWEIISSKCDSHFRIFNLRTDTARSPRTGKTHDFYVLESSAWVNVIPITKDGEVVLVEQYRHGTRDITIEIPGGMVEADDTPIQAARRELLEETGYDAEEIIPFGFVHPNPAIQGNMCYTFLARNTFLAGVQTQDEKEDIQVILKPLAEIPELIRSGAITHSLVIAAFYRLFVEHKKTIDWL